MFLINFIMLKQNTISTKQPSFFTLSTRQGRHKQTESETDSNQYPHTTQIQYPDDETKLQQHQRLNI
jgi:hypothetical protein